MVCVDVASDIEPNPADIFKIEARDTLISFSVLSRAAFFINGRKF